MAPIMTISKVTAMTNEMGMNYLIRPPSTTNYASMANNVFMKNCFVVLPVPRGYSNRNVIHIPELTFI